MHDLKVCKQAKWALFKILKRIVTRFSSALLKGQAHSTDDLQIKIKLVAPPLYVMLCSALDKQKGIDLLSRAIEIMRDEIRKFKGDLQVKAQPRAVDEPHQRRHAFG